jgi:uncharacterized protein (DUF58 family)
VREYVAGDDVRLIDWNVSARFHNLYVKQLMEERELSIVIAMQCSRSMTFGSVRKTKFQMAAEVAATLIFSALHSGDRVGLLLFGASDSLSYIPPNKGMNHGFLLLNRMLDHERTGDVPSSYDVLRFLTYSLKKRSVVFLIGDFIYSEMHAESLAAVSRRHDLICIGVLDPMETEGPPPGIFPFRNDACPTGFTAVSAKTRENYRHLVTERLSELKILLRASRVDYIFLGTDSASEQELHRLFMERIHAMPRH